MNKAFKITQAREVRILLWTLFITTALIAFVFRLIGEYTLENRIIYVIFATLNMITVVIMICHPKEMFGSNKE